MGRDNSWGFWLVLAVVLFLFLPDGKDGPIEVVIVERKVETPKASTLEERMRSAGITCPECPDIPDEMVRVHKTTIAPGVVVHTPHWHYIAFLEEKCPAHPWKPARRECAESIKELRVGYHLMQGSLDPVYGGQPTFTQSMVGFWQRASRITDYHLSFVERMTVGTKQQAYLRKEASEKVGRY